MRDRPHQSGGHPGTSWRRPWVGPGPRPLVRTLPGVSELWVKVQGSGVDLLGHLPQGRKLPTCKRGETETKARPAGVRGREEGGLVGGGLAPKLPLQLFL